MTKIFCLQRAIGVDRVYFSQFLSEDTISPYLTHSHLKDSEHIRIQRSFYHVHLIRACCIISTMYTSLWNINQPQSEHLYGFPAAERPSKNYIQIRNLLHCQKRTI